MPDWRPWRLWRNMPKPKLTGFECYRKEQLAKDLFLGCTGPSILIWGFGPTSHGHASDALEASSVEVYPRDSFEWVSVFSAFQRMPQDSTGQWLSSSVPPVVVTGCACVILDIFEFQKDAFLTWQGMVIKTSSEDVRSINIGNIRARINTLYGLFILVDSQSRLRGMLSFWIVSSKVLSYFVLLLHVLAGELGMFG